MKRPVGRAPKGKTWSDTAGWVREEDNTDTDENDSQVKPIEQVSKKLKLNARVDCKVAVSSALKELLRRNLCVGQADDDGDCCPLAFGAGYEFTPTEAKNPIMPNTYAKIMTIRNKVIDLLTGCDDICTGVPASIFREQEKICLNATDNFDDWRSNGHWSTEDKHKPITSAFQFGVAAISKRPCVVLQRKGEHYHIRVYALRDGNGELVTSPATNGKPMTVHSYLMISFSSVLEMLDTGYPLSIVLYTDHHFSPFLKLVPLRPIGVPRYSLSYTPDRSSP